MSTSLPLALLLASTLLGAAAPPSNTTIFVCPSEDALCRWQGPQGWRPLWRPDDFGKVRDFKHLPGLGVLVLLRGHMDPGRLVLLSEQGQLVLTRELSEGGGLSLPALSGSISGGGAVLCNGDLGAYLCDLWISPPGPSIEVRRLPENCVFPRILDDASAICLEPAQKPRLRIGQLSQQFSDSELPSVRTVQDIAPLRSDAVVLLASDQLYLWRPTGLEPLALPTVLWVSSGLHSRAVYFGRCARDSNLALKDCSVGRVDAEGMVTELFRSGDFVPERMEEETEGVLLVDFCGPAGRKLLSFQQSARKHRELWYSQSPCGQPE